MSRGLVQSLVEDGDAARPGVAAWRHFPQDDQDTIELVRSTLEFQRCYEWDMVKVTPAQSILAEVWGARTEYTGLSLGTRDFVGRVVEGLDGWNTLLVSEGWVDRLRSYVDSITMVRQALGEHAVILATAFSPLSIARYLSGDELFAASTRTRRDMVRRFLISAADVVARFCEDCIRAGADGVFMSLFSAGSGVFSETEYREIAVESDRTVCDAAGQGWFNVLHFHAPYPFLSLASEYGLQAVSWDCRGGGPGVVEVGDACPDKVLVGGVDQDEWLLRGTPGLVREVVSDVVASAEARRPEVARRLVVAPGCTVLQTTPAGNLRAMRDAVLEREVGTR